MRVLAILLVVAVVTVAVFASPSPQEEEVASFKVRVRRSENPSDEKQVLVRVKRQVGFLGDGSSEVYSTETVDNDDNHLSTGVAVLIKAGVMSLIIKGIIAAITGGQAMESTT